MLTLDQVIEKITKVIDLPGEEAHAELSPLPSGLRGNHFAKAKEYRIGAVTVLLYNKKGEPYFVLTQRHVYKGAHSGQISLPGGKYEGSDGGTDNTALRETEEEVGVPQKDVQIIKSLSELYIPPSKFLVYPYVGVITKEFEFKKDDFEVKEVIEIPIHDLINSVLVDKPLAELANVPTYKESCPCFLFGGKIIWGATAMVLNELRHILL
jgi:8-oxo-dGTP pyrophosphatase MutT (NUDIX family)